MTTFSKEKVLLLHQIENIFATFDGVELYPSKEEKAAQLGFSLISNHAFVDGNKRIGMYLMISFLELNGVKIDATNEEVAKLGLDVAGGLADSKDILKWIKAHRV